MYQRCYKLFFKQTYAISHALSGIPSSLTTQRPSRSFFRGRARAPGYVRVPTHPFSHNQIEKEHRPRGTAVPLSPWGEGRGEGLPAPPGWSYYTDVQFYFGTFPKLFWKFWTDPVPRSHGPPWERTSGTLSVLSFHPTFAVMRRRRGATKPCVPTQSVGTRSSKIAPTRLTTCAASPTAERIPDLRSVRYACRSRAASDDI